MLLWKYENIEIKDIKNNKLLNIKFESKVKNVFVYNVFVLNCSRLAEVTKLAIILVPVWQLGPVVLFMYPYLFVVNINMQI